MTRKAIATSFCGELDVEDGDFELRADRLIVYSNEIRFRLMGFDEFGRFSADGTAVADGFGSFSSSMIDANYEADRYDHVRVMFSYARISPKGLKCEVAGLWTQGGETWQFSGVLDRFSPGRKQ